MAMFNDAVTAWMKDDAGVDLVAFLPDGLSLPQIQAAWHIQRLIESRQDYALTEESLRLSEREHARKAREARRKAEHAAAKQRAVHRAILAAVVLADTDAG